MLAGIYSYGFEKPSAIQQRGIKPILDGRDTIGQAQSGTMGGEGQVSRFLWPHRSMWARTLHIMAIMWSGSPVLCDVACDAGPAI